MSALGWLLFGTLAFNVLLGVVGVLLAAWLDQRAASSAASPAQKKHQPKRRRKKRP